MDSEESLSFRGSEIKVAHNVWKVQYPIKDARRLSSDLVVVLYDYSAGPPYRFENLEAFDLKGNKVWTAEQPTTETTEAYTKIAQTAPLVAHTFTAYRCTLDERTGRITTKEFTK